MPQTLLAFLSMMLVAIYAMNVQQRVVTSQRAIILRELEEMAGSVALETMEVIRARPFDQAVLDSTTKGNLGDKNLFSYSNDTDHFTTGRACSVFNTGSADCDDLDDFHKMKTATLPFIMGDETVFFDVDVTVEYVDDDFIRYDGRTFHKQVTVYVRDAWPSSLKPYLREPVTLSRVFSYGFFASD